MGQICGGSKKEKTPLDFEIGIEVKQEKDIAADFDNRRSTLIVDDVQSDNQSGKRPPSTSLAAFLATSNEENEEEKHEHFNNHNGNTSSITVDTNHEPSQNLKYDTNQAEFKNSAEIEDTSSTSKENDKVGVQSNETKVGIKIEGNISEDRKSSVIRCTPSHTPNNSTNEIDSVPLPKIHKQVKDEGNAPKLDSTTQPEKYSTPLLDTTSSIISSTAGISTSDINDKTLECTIDKGSALDIISSEPPEATTAQERSNLNLITENHDGRSDKSENIYAPKVITNSNIAKDTNDRSKGNCLPTVLSTGTISKESHKSESPALPSKVNDDSCHGKVIDVDTNASLMPDKKAENSIVDKNVEQNGKSKSKETSLVEKSRDTTEYDSHQCNNDVVICSGDSKDNTVAFEMETTQGKNNNIHTILNEKDVGEIDKNTKSNLLEDLNTDKKNKAAEKYVNSDDTIRSTPMKSKIPLFVGKTQKTNNKIDYDPKSSQDKETTAPKIDVVPDDKTKDKPNSKGDKSEVFPDAIIARQSSITMSSTYGISEVVSATKVARRLKAKRNVSKEVHNESILI